VACRKLFGAKLLKGKVCEVVITEMVVDCPTQSEQPHARLEFTCPGYDCTSNVNDFIRHLGGPNRSTPRLKRLSSSRSGGTAGALAPLLV
jgi:hypothetical protein